MEGKKALSRMCKLRAGRFSTMFRALWRDAVMKTFIYLFCASMVEIH